MTVAVSDLVWIIALAVSLIASVWAVGTQGTIDFTRDKKTRASAVREQKVSIVVAYVALGVAIVVWLATRAPQITFTLLPR